MGIESGPSSSRSPLPKDDALSILPPDIRELVKDLPEDKLQEALQQLLQADDIALRPLNEADLLIIKVARPAWAT